MGIQNHKRKYEKIYIKNKFGSELNNIKTFPNKNRGSKFISLPNGDFPNGIEKAFNKPVNEVTCETKHTRTYFSGKLKDTIKSFGFIIKKILQ